MPMVPFAQFERATAEAEVRCIHLSESNPWELPADEYVLFELYCDEPGCDCRRVMLNVVSGRHRRREATINFGFDPDDDMRGPFLDPLNEQGEYAEQVLDMVESLVLRDAAYVARLERHYAIVKRIVGLTVPALSPDEELLRDCHRQGWAERAELRRRRKSERKRRKLNRR